MITERSDVRQRSPLRAVDWAVASGLACLAWLMRRDVMPTDGLWHDDAWVAAGTRAPLSDLLLVGNVHPGFTSALHVFDAIVGARGGTFAVPVLVVGVLGPAALYMMLRWSGHDLAVAALLGGALVTSTIHVMYSGRVKQYVIETLVVITLLALLPRLAARRWTIGVAFGWLVGSMALSSLGSFALIAAAAGGAILVLHPTGDRSLRIATVAVQAIVSIAYLLVIMGTFNASQLSDDWGVKYDAYIELSTNPFTVIRSIVEHFREVVAVFPGGWPPLHLLWMALVLVGLAAGCLRPSHRVQAHYGILLLVIAISGATLQRLPFGASGGNPISPGSRASLWLVGPIAVGMALSWKAIRSVIADRMASDGRRVTPRMQWVGLLMAVLLVTVNLDSPAAYPLAGPRSAGEDAMTTLHEDGVLLVGVGALNLVTDVNVPVEVEPTPEQLVGYGVDFTDPRIHMVAEGRRLNDVLTEADQVVVYDALHVFAPQVHEELAVRLRSLGLHLSRRTTYNDTALVAVWTR